MRPGIPSYLLLASIIGISGLALPLPAAEDCVSFGEICQSRDRDTLTVRLGKNAASLQGIEALHWIRFLVIDGRRGDGEPVDLSPLAALPGLRSLYLENLAVKTLDPLRGLPLQKLSLSVSTTPDYTAVADLPQLESLRVYGLRDLAELSPQRLPHLQTLSIFDSPIDSLAGIEEFSRLKTLSLIDTQVSDLSPLGRLDLQKVTLRGPGINDLSPLAGQRSLGFITLNKSRVQSLDGLQLNDNLRSLSARDSALEDIGALAGARELRHLDLQGSQVKEISALAGLHRLEALDLRRTAVADITPLRGLPALKRLWLTDSQVDDLAVLATLDQVQQLSLSNTPATDLSPLAGMDKLSIVWLNGTRASDITPLLDAPALQALRIDDKVFVTREGLPAYIERREPPARD